MKKREFWDVKIKARTAEEVEEELDRMLASGELIPDKDGRFVVPKKNEMDYIIPFKKRPVNIGQGFHGKSHRKWEEDKEDLSYSVDFVLPEGTKIIATRKGIVTKAKGDGIRNYNGKDPKIADIAYKKWMNEIEIRHKDGTFASYCHLKHKGVFVKVGDEVKQGQVIGLSGNTGWSSEPHLDFTVMRKNRNGWKVKSVKIKFKDYKKSLEDNKL